VAVADGVGQRRTQSGQIDSTRVTGVCCNMNSLTRICHALTLGSRQGRSRRDLSYQSRSSQAEMFTRGCGTMWAMPNTNPLTAWKALKEGNERFVAGKPEHPSQSIDHRASLAAGQKPTAVIFGCADSRVAAELIFDQGLGDMFVVRTAGHVIDSAVLGSVEYAVTILNVPLVVVLGHDSCGAVNAALAAIDDGAIPGGFVRDVVERVAPSILMGRREGLTRVDEFEERHVRETVAQLMSRSSAIAERVSAGSLAIAGVTYHLAPGRAVLVDRIGDIGE
jgi:carbonic anhydrase